MYIFLTYWIYQYAYRYEAETLSIEFYKCLYNVSKSPRNMDFISQDKNKTQTLH